MSIDDGSLLAYCGIGFGTLFASYAMMLDTEVSKKKLTGGYFQAAFYNSIRMAQITSAAMMGCCLLLLLNSLVAGKYPLLSAIARFVACWATLWAIYAFSSYYLAAYPRMRGERNTAMKKYNEYTRLNIPPTRR